MGGLSIALDVKLDEALGPLLDAMGGSAPRIRVLDITAAAPQVFHVNVAGVDHKWEVDGLESLIQTLNRAFSKDPLVKALVLLGEWDDMIQVWAVPRAALKLLLGCEWFKPSNPAALR